MLPGKKSWRMGNYVWLAIKKIGSCFPNNLGFPVFEDGAAQGSERQAQGELST